MHVTTFDNRSSLKNIVDRYLKRKELNVYDRLFNFDKSFKNLADTDDRINMITVKYKPYKEIELKTKKRSISI